MGGGINVARYDMRHILLRPKTPNFNTVWHYLLLYHKLFSMSSFFICPRPLEREDKIWYAQCRRYIDDDDIWTQRILLARWKTVKWQDPEASNSNQQQFGRRKLQSRTVKGGYSRSHSTIHTQSSSFPFVLAAGVFGFTFFFYVLMRKRVRKAKHPIKRFAFLPLLGNAALFL
jgi:hypothetical protein